MSADTAQLSAELAVVHDDRLAEQLTVVLLLHNCERWVARTLQELSRLEIPIVAVDNASSDGTVALVRGFAGVEVIELAENVGAAGRNVGARHARTPYVAFCDDDGFYERAGLERAVDTLERHPEVALVNARIVVGPEQEPDPISIEMAASPLRDPQPLPGTRLLSFMGGACVVRRHAYLGVGGYDERFFIGGEEETLAWPLAKAGWQMRYQPDVVMHHHPSLANYTRIRHFGIRNTLWNAWLHRPLRSAVRYSLLIVATSPKDTDLARGLWLTVRGLPWVLRRREPVARELDAELRVLEERRFAAVLGRWPAYRRRIDR
jgi:GT2 family glycosyltransferase